MQIANCMPSSAIGWTWVDVFYVRLIRSLLCYTFHGRGKITASCDMLGSRKDIKCNDIFIFHQYNSARYPLVPLMARVRSLIKEQTFLWAFNILRYFQHVLCKDVIQDLCTNWLRGVFAVQRKIDTLPSLHPQPQKRAIDKRSRKHSKLMPTISVARLVCRTQPEHR